MTSGMSPETATSSLENDCPIFACVDDRNEEHRFGPEKI